MRVKVSCGDALSEFADVLICTAHPMLRLFGEEHAEILRRGGYGVQDELDRHLRALGVAWVEPGTVVRTGPGPLPVKHILHAVGMDTSYQSTTALVSEALKKALVEAAVLEADTVATTAIAAGSGLLPMRDFACALREALRRDHPAIEELRVVIRRLDDAALVEGMLGV